MATLIPAVLAMRSYLRTLEANSMDTSALASWIDRNANTTVQRQEQFPTDAAIGVLNYYGHPLFTNSNLTQDQLNWASLMGSAEQIIQQEDAWANQQVSRNNNTMFARVFGSDVTWIDSWATANLPPNTLAFEYKLNALIDALRTCQGPNGSAGSINHQIHSGPVEEPR